MLLAIYNWFFLKLKHYLFVVHEFVLINWIELMIVHLCLGELKEPSKAIPKGTLYAVMFTFISYLLLIILVGGSSDR